MKYLTALFIILNIADLVTTLIIKNHPNFIELNPVINLLSLELTILYKAIVTIIPIVLLKLVSKKLQYVVYIIMIVILAFVVFFNTYQLLVY